MDGRQKASRAICCLLLICSGLVSTGTAGPVISEFMASNRQTLADEDGDYSDWIEIYNPDAAPADLAGWALTDKATKLTQWVFPAVTLPPGGYLVVFASSKNRRPVGGPLHTNFDLKAAGEYLALVKPDGKTRATEFAPTFPPQSNDISYGSCVDNGQASVVGYFATPTPGLPNNPPEQVTRPPDTRLAQTVSFLRPVGPFTTPFDLGLTGADPGQQIRYVLADPAASPGADLPEPTLGSTLYTQPIAVQSSVLVRAAVFDPDTGLKGPTATSQYLLLEPSSVNNTSDFTSVLPVIVLDDHGSGTLPVDDAAKRYRPSLLSFFEPVNGVVRLASTPTLFTRAGLRLHGNSSQYFPKKSFRLDLWDEGNNEVAQPLLGLAADQDWDIISPWLYDNTSIHNAFMYELSRQVGQWAPQTRLAEVFTNFDGGKLDYDDYAGLGVLTETVKVSPTRLNITKLKATDVSGEALTGGYVFKIDMPDPGDLGWTTDHGIPQNSFNLGQVIILDTPSAKKAAPEQVAYLKGYLQQFEDALFADRATGFATRNYTNYIDVDSWIDYHLLNTLAYNMDGLWNSEYFYKDRGGKIKAGPIWDFDKAFNTSLAAANPGPRVWNYWNVAFSYDWWAVLFDDPQFVQAWLTR